MAKRGRPKKNSNPEDFGQDNPDAVEGHNSKIPLTDAERQAIYFPVRRTILDLRSELAEVKETGKTINEKIKAQLKILKDELGITKKDFEYADALEADSGGEMANEHRRMLELARWHSHPIGTQGDLFASADGTVTGNGIDKTPLNERAGQEGWKAGLEGLKCEPPASYPQEAQQAWIQRWHDGQAQLASGIKQLEPRPEPAFDDSITGDAEGVALAPDDDDSVLDAEFDEDEDVDPKTGIPYALKRTAETAAVD